MCNIATYLNSFLYVSRNKLGQQQLLTSTLLLSNANEIQAHDIHLHFCLIMWQIKHIKLSNVEWFVLPKHEINIRENQSKTTQIHIGYKQKKNTTQKTGKTTEQHGSHQNTGVEPKRPVEIQTTQ